ncbi:hypothetical protein GPALN_012924 [Globodera pallida]|nr:hypothetical protein GPALN_012924 [Globodera pallida]
MFRTEMFSPPTQIFGSFLPVLLFLLLFADGSLRADTLFVSTRKAFGVGALWNLNEMTECKLHYTALVYDDYGCWCGIGGSGTPIDGIDLCCKLHDKCYDSAVDQGLCYDTYIEYAEPYSWSCEGSELTCPGQQIGCKAALCECDKHVVDCWSKFIKPSKKKKCVHRPLHKDEAKENSANFMGIFSIFIYFVWNFLSFFI